MAVPSIVPSRCAAVLWQSGHDRASFILDIVDVRCCRPCRPTLEVAVAVRSAHQAGGADKIMVEHVSALLAVIALRAKARRPPGVWRRDFAGAAAGSTRLLRSYRRNVLQRDWPTEIFADARSSRRSSHRPGCRVSRRCRTLR